MCLFCGFVYVCVFDLCSVAFDVLFVPALRFRSDVSMFSCVNRVVCV